MWRLDPHEAAKRLYEMRRKRERADIRQPVTGGAMAPPPEYRFPLVGIKNGEVGGANNTGVKDDV